MRWFALAWRWLRSWYLGWIKTRCCRWLRTWRSNGQSHIEKKSVGVEDGSDVGCAQHAIVGAKLGIADGCEDGCKLGTAMMAAMMVADLAIAMKMMYRMAAYLAHWMVTQMVAN